MHACIHTYMQTHMHTQTYATTLHDTANLASRVGIGRYTCSTYMMVQEEIDVLIYTF